MVRGERTVGAVLAAARALQAALVLEDPAVQQVEAARMGCAAKLDLRANVVQTETLGGEEGAGRLALEAHQGGGALQVSAVLEAKMV